MCPEPSSGRVARLITSRKARACTNLGGTPWTRAHPSSERKLEGRGESPSTNHPSRLIYSCLDFPPPCLRFGKRSCDTALAEVCQARTTIGAQDNQKR